MRIAVGGMAVECCSFSPLPTRLDDLTILRGNDLLAQYPFIDSYPEVEFSPLLRARATPGGPVDNAVYQHIKADFLNALERGGPWEGVYLDMHGAMFVSGMEDAEGDWIAAVRAIVGPDCLIAASYDLHGNVSSQVIAHLDLLTAYRTAPHIDVTETRARAVALLVKCLREGIRPVMAFVPIPILLPGEKAMTTAEPTRSLYASLPEVIEHHGLLDASLLVGYAWADEPRVAASAIAVGQDAEGVKAAAHDLAASWWSKRANFAFSMPTGSIDDCIIMAQAAVPNGTPIFISDAGDNITGGGVGDVTTVLQRLLEHRVENAVYASIVDSDAVAICCTAHTDQQVTLSLGGKLDTAHSYPLPITGRVQHISDHEAGNRQVVLQVQGIKVIITERRTAFTIRAQFTALELHLATTDIVVVKLGYLFPELREIAATTFLAFSPGAINPQIETLAYQRLTRPVYPLDAEMHWQPSI
ncbi:MAG: M81 family metallopeptidase [Anaerolineae bacterium]